MLINFFTFFVVCIIIIYIFTQTFKNYIMKTFKIQLKNTLSNSNSSYSKKFGGILTKYVNVKTKADLKCIPNYNKIISIEEA